MANLQAGFARVDVTPPLGIEISGYFVERFASGILDALEASALALRCGDDQAILIALDNLMIDKETMHAYRAAIAERTGVKAEAVFIACSHTHTGPLVGKSELDENKYGVRLWGDGSARHDGCEVGLRRGLCAAYRICAPLPDEGWLNPHKSRRE